MKLYLYDHCPFCVKARMIFGLTETVVDEVYLLNDDEQTPIRMIGAKMLPILQKDDATFMPESMDIVRYIDQLTGRQSIFRRPSQAVIAEWVSTAFKLTHPLVMPRTIQYTNFPEFATQGAKDYFQQNKEKMIGSFAQAWQQTPELIQQLMPHLEQLEKLIQSPDAIHGERSEDDLHVFAVLRCLSLTKGITYPAKVSAFMQRLSVLSKVPLLWDKAL
ncbi:glutaredoxin 2 [Pseudomonas sp. F1_0610]|uniref:glutaredoxin 2 n=1 Tax=Pseudomonas sp. F1_0610 TaxID=3114284 RepID=UPI0039C17D96